MTDTLFVKNKAILDEIINYSNRNNWEIFKRYLNELQTNF